jgi:hypothetical protein
MAVDPTGEYHEQQLKRLKRWGHCSAVYRLTNHRASPSSRLARSPIAAFEFLDSTGLSQQRVETHDPVELLFHELDFQRPADQWDEIRV